MASPEEFQPYRKVQVKYDKQLAQVLESTARSIQARILRLPRGVGGEVRAAQLRLALAEIRKLQQSMWRNGVAPIVTSGVEAAIEASDDAVETMTRVAYTALAPDVAETLVRGLRAAARSGIESDRARRIRELSPRVYDLAALHGGKIEQLIREGLIANLSAKELAGSVYKYVSPTTPGGASYAAMRLARTEINNAFHERQIEGAKRPGVSGVNWNLSGSHKVPDKCNIYAQTDQFHKGKGVFPVDQIPEKPHPQCFCYLTYVTIKPGEFAKAFESGQFDDEIDKRTRDNIARLTKR